VLAGLVVNDWDRALIFVTHASLKARKYSTVSMSPTNPVASFAYTWIVLFGVNVWTKV
jgi:hypothetical protein